MGWSEDTQCLDSRKILLLDSYRAAEAPGGVVRICAVMIHEDMVVAAIGKDGAAEFSYINGCFHPARRFHIEISKLLQLPVLFFR